MTAAITDYTGLITSEHASAPKFVAAVTAAVQGFVDLQNLLTSLPPAFDIDRATGDRLDTAGQWVGISRNLLAIAPGFHTSAPPAVVPLTDPDYSAVIHSKARANSWDGTIATAAANFSTNFLGANSYVFMVDGQDMTMQVAMAGQVPNASLQAALVGGFMEVRPSAVLASYFIPSAPGPIFGFDNQSPTGISGFDTGVWATQIG